MEAQNVFPTTPLLRPEQVSTQRDEIEALESKLQNKHIEDKAEVARQLRRVRKDFETQVPRPPENPVEEDRMVRRARQLLSEITEGMPSQEEMRKSPPGAVEKHREWESRNKPKIMEWKHIMLRVTAGSNDRDAANLEKHRPRTSTLSMDNAQIQGKQIFLPENPDGRGVTFSDAQLALLKSLDPEMAARIGSLSNSQRARVKEIVGIGLEVEAPSAASIAGKKGAEKKRQMSEEQKAALAAGRAKAKARREAEKKQD